MDYSLALVLAILLTGGIWFLDVLWRLFKRNVLVDRHEVRPSSKRHWIIDYARAFFPVLLIVFLLRSFVIEPFRIPSGSMLPTLQIGDYILVNKYQYGIRIPVANDKFIEIGSPKFGDVMVFRYPQDESVNFIKRVIGLPGDTVHYIDKTLYINDQEVRQSDLEEYWINPKKGRKIQTALKQEEFADETHQILIDNKKTSRNLKITVPENTYFVMGDNRDYSNDSRYWGFVPEELIIGKAFFIWFSWDFSSGDGINWSRIAAAIE